MSRDMSYPNPVRSGVKWAKNKESYTTWYFFDEVLNEEQVEDFVYDENLHGFCGGAGRQFGSEPDVTHSRSHTLIQQSVAWDI